LMRSERVFALERMPSLCLNSSKIGDVGDQAGWGWIGGVGFLKNLLRNMVLGYGGFSVDVRLVIGSASV
jgi:hypothetical protein